MVRLLAAIAVFVCSSAGAANYRFNLEADSVYKSQHNNTMMVSHLIELDSSLLSEPNKSASFAFAGADDAVLLTVSAETNDINLRFNEYDIYNYQLQVNLESQLALYNQFRLVYNLFFYDDNDRWQARATYNGRHETITTSPLPESTLSEFGGVISTSGPAGGFVVVEALGMPEPSSTMLAAFILALSTSYGQRNSQ